MNFAEHVVAVTKALDRALSLSARGGAAFDGVLIHSGAQRFYHPRDREVPFAPYPHFARLCPAAEPDLWLRYVPGETPRVVRCVRRDFWHAAPPHWPDAWRSALEVVEVEDENRARTALGDLTRMAYLGEPEAAHALSIPDAATGPARLLSALDWARSEKTRYEVEQIRQAGARAADGHGVVARMVLQGRSERAMHAAYLAASRQLEHDTPYTNIIAWDEHSATLHYADKRAETPDPGHVLLIDAGASCLGYASDITRTHASPDAPALFRALLDAMQGVQRRLVAAVAPGVRFVDLHRQAEREILCVLCEARVIKADLEAALEARLAGTFFPHGLGHMLGLEVHDVAGRQRDEAGETLAPPEDVPALRTTRTLAPGHVVTIEPGLYFIPLRLDELRQAPRRRRELLDWKAIDALVPCGGIRIEDDVLVTDDGHEDLTHERVDSALSLHEARGPGDAAPATG